MKDLRNKLILGGLLGLAVVVGLLLYADVRETGVYLRGFPILYIAPILALTLFNYVLRWIKWHFYLRLIGVGGISRTDSAALWVSGFVLALSPGKVAELLKAAVLRAMTGTPVARSAPIIVAERVTDGLAMLILGAIGFGGMLSFASGPDSVLPGYVPAYLAVLGILIAGIVTIQVRPLFLWLLGIAGRLPAVRRISQPLHDLYESSYELFRPRALLFAVGLGIVSWVGECVGAYLILRGLGIEPSWLLLWQATFILASASILGAVSGLPGGLGAAEFTIAGMVQILILNADNAAFGGTAALLIRLATLWFAVLLGLVTAFAFRRRLFPPQVAQAWRSAHSGVDGAD